MDLRKEDTVLEVVTRDKWSALPPKAPEPVVHPISYVFYGSTGGKECLTHDACAEELVAIQKADMKKTFDIKFNFLVSGDGTLFEGRGWKYKPKIPMRYRDDQYTSLYIVSGDGTVYEGRGWNYKPKLPVRYRDDQYTSLFIGFMGKYDVTPPSKTMFEIKNALIKFGMENNYIDKQILEFDLENVQKVENM